MVEMAGEAGAGRWTHPCTLMGTGAMVGGGAFGVGGISDLLAGLFFAGGVVLTLVGTFEGRLRKGSVELAGAGRFEFELEEGARAVTTDITSTPDPVLEVGPDEEDDATRWLLADVLFKELFETPRWDGLEDCHFQVHLYDPDLGMLLPILASAHVGPSPGFEPNQGTVGTCWESGEYVVATGDAVSDETFNLTPEQQERFTDLTVSASVPVTNAAGRTIGVVSGSSRNASSALASVGGLEVQIFLAEAAAIILVDVLKWFSNGYDDIGGRETPWSAR